MENIYSVAISCKNDLGYIEYDSVAKSANIVLANAETKRKVEDFLNNKLDMQIPHESLHDFTDVVVEPLADIDSFQLALTRLWDATSVHVDWSRPVEYVKQHRTLK